MTADKAPYDKPPTTAEQARQFLGRQVRVMYGIENATKLVAEGRLIALDEGGGLVIVDDDDFVHYCWPNLVIIEER